MPEAKSIAVNIVAWNSVSYFPNLFASLEEQVEQDFAVTVVDNASNDGTVEWIQGNHPGVGTLRNYRNQGFCRAHNQAITLALTRWDEADWDKRYLIVLNPDIELAADCLQLLREAMDANPSLDACGPKLLRAFTRAEGDDGRRITERTTVIDSTGISINKSRRSYDRGAGETDQAQYDTAVDVFGLSGAFVMFRASSLAKLKIGDEFFDEDMFAYQEDVDLAWRARRFGMQAKFIPSAIAWHHRRAPSADQGFLWLKAFVRRFSKPAYVNTLSTRNHIWLIWKNDELGNLLLHLPWIGLYEFGKFVVGIFSLSTWRAWGQALSGLPNILKKRKSMASNVRVMGKSLRRWFV